MKSVIVCAVVVVYVALSVGIAMTKLPFNDEGWLASPGLNLITKGSMGTSALEPAGTWLLGINTHTYWIMPLHPLNLAIWYDVFGFSALSMRTLSIFWGLVALIAWYAMVRALTRDSGVALLAASMIALDYHFIALSAVGRMDMMSAALGFAGLAIYLVLRERYFLWSLAASHACFAASCLTHPYGGMAMVGGLFLLWYFDRDRFRWTYWGAMALPYVVAGVGWGYYIAQNPDAFMSQFGGNATAGGRFSQFAAPWNAIYSELSERYLSSFGFGPGASMLEHVRIFILLAYVAGVGAALASPQIRRHRGRRALLILAGLYFLMMTFGEGKKAELYIVYAIPFWAAILAVWAHDCWKNGPIRRVTLVTVLSGLVLLQTGNSLYAINRNNYVRRYLPTIQFIKGHATKDTVVMGPSELGFELGFNGNLVDDFNLGYHSGKRPDFIVIDQNYRDVIAYRRGKQAALDAYVSRLLTQEFHRVYGDAAYDVYARR